MSDSNEGLAATTETGNQGNGEAAAAAAAAVKKAKAKPDVEKVTMGDGRVVDFVGKRNLNKEFKVDGDTVSAIFDFRNGETRKITVGPSDPILLHFAGHGMLQKIGDETAGVTDKEGRPDVDSMVMGVDALIKRLADTSKSIDDRWFAERAAGDSFSGASLVVKAVAEVMGKDIGWVKEWLEKKLEAGKATGLTRQKLYQAFRGPETRTAPVIERLERERNAGKPAVNANELLDEAMAQAEGEGNNE